METEAEKVAEQRSPDQDAAIEAAFVAGTLPEDDRRAPEPASAATAPVATKRVSAIARQRGFDGTSLIEPGERFEIDLKPGESVPEWADLVPEPE